MTTLEMGLTLGSAASLASSAVAYWLLVARENRRTSADPCPYCGPHAKASHAGAGCNVMVLVTGGRKRCLCTAPYGEPR
jgi:hypothetical protein